MPTRESTRKFLLYAVLVVYVVLLLLIFSVPLLGISIPDVREPVRNMLLFQ
jgi:hypothetical protein